MGLEASSSSRLVHSFKLNPSDRLCLQLRDHLSSSSRGKCKASRGLDSKVRDSRDKGSKGSNHSSVRMQQDVCIP